MKLKFTLLAIFFISIVASAQQGINYKALIKDASGNVLGGTFMNVQFTIHETTMAGTIAYQENHSSYTTTANGMIILNIGTGTPTIGIFTNIDWATNTHYLNTTISYSGGNNIDLGTTQFMTVPYAMHSKTSEAALNITGLEKITENGNTGWRLVGQDTANYGDIGSDAVDLSNNPFASPTYGATGDNSIATGIYTKASGERSTAMGSNTTASGEFSIAMGSSSTASKFSSTAIGDTTTASGNYSTAIGKSTTASGNSSTAMGNATVASNNYSTAMGLSTAASGNYSTAMGINTIASGDSSTAMGDSTKAESYSSTAIGINNIGGGTANAWVPTDPLFEIGNSYSVVASNALTILKNGTITAPSFDLIEITDDKALVTKEYLDANFPPFENETKYNFYDFQLIENLTGYSKTSIGVHFPNGTVLGSVSAFVMDNNAGTNGTSNSVFIILSRISKTSNTASPQEIYRVSSTTTANDTFTSQFDFTSSGTGRNIINNDTYIYYMTAWYCDDCGFKEITVLH